MKSITKDKYKLFSIVYTNKLKSVYFAILVPFPIFKAANSGTWGISTRKSLSLIELNKDKRTLANSIN